LKEIEALKLEEFSLLDVGAGSGELLRVTARWAQESKRKTFLVGLEFNERSARAIAEESQDLKEIMAVRADALSLPFSDGTFDYAMCSLFTHHFPEAEIVTILKEMRRVARRGVWVIDLHRHPVAYCFYTTVGRLFLHNRLIREDGALSILRSFKPGELARLGTAAGFADVQVKRHFPYRLVMRGKSQKWSVVSGQ
jgi:ubiquinone/menaquinone biosynthesis C-methylase UbiE